MRKYLLKFMPIYFYLLPSCVIYDATGKRSLEIKNGNYGIMIWDGDYVVAETEKNNVKSASKPIANKYFRGHKLFANKSTNGVGYYTYDAHGSVVGMSNETYRYDAFGNQITNTTTYNPFRYCGEYMEPDTGLIYLRNRYYDPTIGRFITEDPVKDGLNWYVYCGNNPIMYVDPWGLLSYILYTTNSGADFSEQALWQKNYLEQNGEEVVMCVVNTIDSFVESWNSIEDGAEKVIIYSHGNDRSLILEAGSSVNALTIDGKNSAGNSVGNLGYLEKKDITEVQILSCNTGNLDAYSAGVGNVATVFSWLVTGEVYAYDGNVSFGIPYVPFEIGGASSRLSNDQDAFRNITAWYHSGQKYYRNPQGKVKYRDQKRILYPGSKILPN